jgi:hypothetical protein
MNRAWQMEWNAEKERAQTPRSVPINYPQYPKNIRQHKVYLLSCSGIGTASVLVAMLFTGAK